jgi:hypothetical protein
MSRLTHLWTLVDNEPFSQQWGLGGLAMIASSKCQKFQKLLNLAM